MYWIILFFVRNWTAICFELSERNAPDVICPWLFWLRFAPADFDPSEGAQPLISMDEDDGVSISSNVSCGDLWTFHLHLKFTLSWQGLRKCTPSPFGSAPVWTGDNGLGLDVRGTCEHGA